MSSRVYAIYNRRRWIIVALGALLAVQIVLFALCVPHSYPVSLPPPYVAFPDIAFISPPDRGSGRSCRGSDHSHLLNYIPLRVSECAVHRHASGRPVSRSSHTSSRLVISLTDRLGGFLPAHRIYAVFCAYAAAFDCLIFGLTAYRCIRTWLECGKVDLVQIILRDGMIYFTAIVPVRRDPVLLL
jgi:hypothetical protein